MSLLPVLLPLWACDGQPVAPEPAFAPTRIVVPVPGVGSTIASPTMRITTPALAASEGRLEARATKATIGVASTAWIRIFPASGYHINTEYPFTLKLSDPPAGMTYPSLIETSDSVTEGQLAVPIALTATQAGTFRVTGSIQFGICESDRCLSRAMPVVVEVTSCDSGSAC